MPTKKKAGKGEGRSRNSATGKGEAKAAPVGASEASAAGSSRVTKTSGKGNTTPASKKAQGASAEKPRARRDAATKASTKGARGAVDPVSAVLSDARPTHEQIAVRAYELFASSGYQDGHCEEHWLQAERELKREYAAEKPAPRRPRQPFSSF